MSAPSIRNLGRFQVFGFSSRNKPKFFPLRYLLQICREFLIADNISGFGFQELGVPVTHSNAEVVCGSDVVFVAVKPHLVPHVLGEISQHVTDRHIIVSVAAGVTLATLEEVGVFFKFFNCVGQKFSCSSLSIASFYLRTQWSSG